MRQITVWGGFSDFKFGAGIYDKGALGVCFTPTCKNYIECRFIKSKLFSKCVECGQQLRYSRKAYKFMRAREKTK